MDRAAAHGPIRALCLVRARALQAMLEAHGIHGSRVVVGVRLADGEFGAHAWVEYGTAVLGDSGHHVARFVPFSDGCVRPLQ